MRDLRSSPVAGADLGGAVSASRASVCVIGAGPAGLAFALAMHRRAPAVDLTVVDPAGEWLAVWDRQFAYQQIPHLRSPAVHHPHPAHHALLERAGDADLVPSGGTKVPTTAFFAEFCRDAIEGAGLQDAVTAGAAVGLQVRGDQAEVTVTDAAGRLVRRRHDRVVVATNRRLPQVPAWALGASAARLASEVDVRQVEAGSRIAIVGGGMTAGHLCVGAVAAGARVHHVTRGRLRVRRFDTDPGWLGPKQLQPFECLTDMTERRRRVSAARGGGSVTHRLAGQLAEARRHGSVLHHERDAVVDLEPGARDRGLQLQLRSGGTIEVDEVWLATGGQVDVGSDPLFADLHATHPVEVLDGLPVLDHDLRWGGAPVHVVGAAAGLQLGPLAGNLVGHRRAADRVVASCRDLASRAGSVLRP